MDIALLIIGFFFILLGIVGSFLPILPGPPISWIGLLLLHLTDAVPMDKVFLGITLIVAIAIFILDYTIPAIGTKKFGGSRYGMIGTTIGLIVGIIAPIPLGILIGPFVGAFIGETLNKADSKTALKAAFGSFLGFLASTFMKFVVSFIFAVFFVAKAFGGRSEFFG